MKCYICKRPSEHFIKVLSPHEKIKYHFCVICWELHIRPDFQRNVELSKAYAEFLQSQGKEKQNVST